MEGMTLEVDEGGCGRLHLDLPADATDEEIAYITTFIERIGSALLELDGVSFVRRTCPRVGKR